VYFYSQYKNRQTPHHLGRGNGGLIRSGLFVCSHRRLIYTHTHTHTYNTLFWIIRTHANGLSKTRRRKYYKSIYIYTSCASCYITSGWRLTRLTDPQNILFTSLHHVGTGTVSLPANLICEILLRSRPYTSIVVYYIIHFY